jgi:hypothetical protein
MGKGGGRRDPPKQAREVEWKPGVPGRQGGAAISEEGGKGGKAHTSSTTAGSVGRSGQRKLILRWPEFSTMDFGQLDTEKTQKNLSMEVNGARFGLRKNGIDAMIQ